MSDVTPNHADEQHGGNLSTIAARYPSAPRPFIDLSTGINPYPYPLPPTAPESAHRLADSADMQAAYAAAAKHYAAKDNVVFAAGMQPLMFALAALRFKEHGASTISIASPTYAEHARVWQSMGHTVSPSPLGGGPGWGHMDTMEVQNAPLPTSPLMGEELSDVTLLCNPNNPDGRSFQPEQLLTLAKRSSWLIVDESFADVVHNLSITAHVATHDNLIVLRSCGKFYGIAGMRISLTIAPQKIAAFLRSATGPWPISTEACRILPAMLADTSWATDMREQLETESAHWRELLSRHFTVIGHTSLFTLVETENASQWFDKLAAQGILVRKFDYNQGWLRFGLPQQSDLKRLETALKNAA